MGRRAEIPGSPVTVVIQVKMTDDDVELIEQKRGEMTRPAYIRSLVRAQGPLSGGSVRTPDPNQPELPITETRDVGNDMVQTRVKYPPGTPSPFHNHQWAKTGAFDRCTTCETRRPHQTGTK